MRSKIKLKQLVTADNDKSDCAQDNGKTTRQPSYLLGLMFFIAISIFCWVLFGITTNSAMAAGNAGEVVVEQFPKQLQLYPRSTISNTAEVSISGIVESGSDFTAIKVLVKRNGTEIAAPNMVLDYSNGDAPFSFSISIVAELANYDFELVATDNIGDTTIRSVANVVAGDVYLINGQSNANARIRTGSESVGPNSGNNAFIRSYGRRETFFPGPIRPDNSTIDPLDDSWYVAKGDSDNGSAEIGQWGVDLGRKLVSAYGIPVAFLNNAVSATAINKHQSNYSNWANPYSSEMPNNNIYQRLLWRAKDAGVADHVRAMLWYQGEADAGLAAAYDGAFNSLYNDWMSDYPNLEQVYVHQIRNITSDCGEHDGDDIELRDLQRRLGDDPRYPNLQVMSTTAVDAQIEDCHFPYTFNTALSGHSEIAKHMFDLMARDFYGSSNTQNIDAPNIDFAYFTDATKQSISMVMRDPDDTLQFVAGAEQDFLVEAVTAPVILGAASGNTILLTLSNSAAGASGISYLGHEGVDLKNVPQSNWTTAEPRWGQWVTNANGVGLLAFYNAPIAEDLPTIAITDPISGTVVELGQPITIQYAAADVDGLLSTTLFVDTGLITETVWNSSPGSITNSIAWTPPAAGSYTFTANVEDVRGARSSAASVTIQVNTPPTINIVNPVDGAVFPSNSSVTIQTAPQDSDGVIVGTSLFADTVLITNTVVSAPWEYIWMNVPSGTYSLTATATDDDGGSAMSPAVTIRVNEVPTITLLSPITGTIFIHGETAPLIGASPADLDGSIASVEFYDNATLLTSLTAAPWTFNWISAPAGTHVLTAKTVDNDGEMAVSNPVNIEVVMPTPTPTETPTPVPPTETPTPTPTQTPTPVPPTETPTPTPTETSTPVPPTETPTLVPPTETPTPVTVASTPTPIVTDAPPTPVASATTVTPAVATDTPATGPTLTLANETMSGAPGSNFVVLGNGFEPGESIAFSLNGESIGSFTTNDSGELVLVIKTLPEIPTGAYSVKADEFATLSTAFVVQSNADVVTPTAAGAEITIPISEPKPTENLLFLPLVSQ